MNGCALAKVIIRNAVSSDAIVKNDQASYIADHIIWALDDLLDDPDELKKVPPSEAKEWLDFLPELFQLYVSNISVEPGCNFVPTLIRIAAQLGRKKR